MPDISSQQKAGSMHALAYHQCGHFHDGRHFVDGEHSTGAKTAIVMLMFAHAAFDLTALAIIYLGLEERVAHLIF